MGGLRSVKIQFNTFLQSSLVFSVVVISSLAYANIAHAIGITPPEVSVSSVLRNSTQVKSVTVSKDPSQLSEDYIYTTDVRFEDPSVIEVAPVVEIPAGRQNVQVPFTINTKNLANGTYTAVLLFYESKKEKDVPIIQENSSASVSVVAGVAAKITFTVGGEETVGYEIHNLQAQSTETDDPVPVNFTIFNTGNVSWRPERVEFIFADELDSQNTETVIVSGSDIESTGPGAEQTISLNLRPKLTQGSYIMTAVFYYGGVEVERIDTQVFDVFAPNTLAQSGEFSDITSNKETYAIGENIRVTATFENTGEIRVSGVMVTTIEKDSVVTDIRKTSQLDIDAGETSEFEDIFTLDDSGKYILTLYIEYGNKKTSKRSIEIEILPSESSGNSAFLWILLLALSALIIVIAIVARRRRSKRQEQPLADSPLSAGERRQASKKSSLPTNKEVDRKDI